MEEKRILVLADVNSSHTQKWVAPLMDRGYRVLLFTLSVPTNKWTEKYDKLELVSDQVSSDVMGKAEAGVGKLGYLKSISTVKKLIKNFKPHLLHAHYATSYGLLAARSGFHPYFLTLWGSDVLLFPKNGWINKQLLRYNLSKPDQLFVASKVLQEATKQYSSKDVTIIPFGIDLEQFKPVEKQSKELVTFGIVKSLETVYGIDLLIEAFARVFKKYPNKIAGFTIAGSGLEEEKLKNLASQLGVQEKVKFIGRILHEEVPNALAGMDIFLNTSRSESFGVSVLEASACELPVIVSDVGGLPEVVRNGETGLIVPAENIDAIAEAMEKLLLDKELRLKMGKKGRAWVQERYDIHQCLELMEQHYKKALS